MKRVVFFAIICFLFCLNVSAQKSTDTTRIAFEKAYSEMDAMLGGKQTLSFKRAVFLSENAYLENRLSYSAFDLSIKSAAYYCQKMAENVPLNHPKEKPLGVNYAIFQHITDTTQHIFGKDTFNFLPYKYDFQDFNGQKNWESMFVTKMLREGTGNCRSLPYYYKLLADECGVQACLALAPNHVYIKHWDVGKKKEGWMKRIYNIELTNGSFPMDGWLMASGYITLDAIRNGFYLDTLGARRSVALCLLDLAKGYERKFGKRDAFVSKCVERVLQVHPSNINALLLKSELLKDQYERTKLPADYQKLYGHCSTLVANGYREMPLDMYLNWLFEVRAKANAFENVKYLPKKFDTYKGHPYKDDSVMRKKVPMQTLTDGRYDEFPDFAETTYVGSAVYDVYNKKIVGFIKRDTLYSEATLEPDVVSRWLSTDPIFHPYESPYTAFANNPVYFVDPRGTTVGDYYDKEKNKLGTDGANDGKKYIVTSQDDISRIEEMNNNNVPIPKGELQSAIPLPSLEEMREFESTFNHLKTQNNERGVLVGTDKHGKTVFANTTGKVEEVDLNGLQNIFNQSNIKRQYDIHTHKIMAREINGSIEITSNDPSEADFFGRGTDERKYSQLKPSVILSHTGIFTPSQLSQNERNQAKQNPGVWTNVLKPGHQTITFYNSKGVLYKDLYINFKSLREEIDDK